jgi:hypothetical protein
MKKILFFSFIFLVSFGFSLEKAPWFGEVYEFHFLSKYTFFRYNSVDSALISLDSPSNNHLMHFNIAFAPSLQWSMDSDLEFISSPMQNFGFRSVAFQTRYLFKDDILGDPLSICLGFNLRVISSDSLKDVSNLFHSNTDFELNLAFGKEFSRLDYWRFRFWGYGAVGKANKGSLWIKGKIALEGNADEKRKWSLFILGMHGYGKQEFVDIYDFNGYAKIRERNIDAGLKYGYRLNVWGTLSFEYKRRILAKRCPKDVNFFSVSYVIPFSF